MTTILAPERSLDQRMAALRRANQIRVDRAKLKRALKTGAMSVVDVLDDVPDFAATMKAYDLLMALPKFGRVKAQRVLNQCRISMAKTVGGMSDRQRREMIVLLGHGD